MIRTDIGESFPIVAIVYDESTQQLIGGQTVYYDLRYSNDTPLSPTVAGTLPESSVETGVYRKLLTLSGSGEYICYVTCSGYASNVEDIIVNQENIYSLVKDNRNYNIGVEDIIRTNDPPTASQTIRKVPFNKTDYIVTIIKGDDDDDWGNTTVSGLVFAWYKNVTDNAPYKMGGVS